jgi:hypothetical protein
MFGVAEGSHRALKLSSGETGAAGVAGTAGATGAGATGVGTAPSADDVEPKILEKKAMINS